MLIDGKLVPASDGATYDNVNPATEEARAAVARRLRTGTVIVNGGMYYGADAPFGGYKASGLGRQNGIEGLEQYLETKTIAYAST